jgi:hypothetical protein
VLTIFRGFFRKFQVAFVNPIWLEVTFGNFFMTALAAFGKISRGSIFHKNNFGTNILKYIRKTM